MDAPKTLAYESERNARLALLSQPHARPLASLVEKIRQAKGPGYRVPYFDPLDGGVNASILFLLEAPGPKAVASGFVSRDNPDETAKNFYLLNKAAGIDRRTTIVWNAVPWYIGSGAKIRAATKDDVRQADAWLEELLNRLSQLRKVVIVGKKALHTKATVRKLCPTVRVFEMPHPSPMFINRSPENRLKALSALLEIARPNSSVGSVVNGISI
jgi:uracil-DNA glycosylase